MVCSIWAAFFLKYVAFLPFISKSVWVQSAGIREGIERSLSLLYSKKYNLHSKLEHHKFFLKLILQFQFACMGGRVLHLIRQFSFRFFMNPGETIYTLILFCCIFPEFVFHLCFPLRSATVIVKDGVGHMGLQFALP